MNTSITTKTILDDILYDYQKDGSNFLISKPRAILADDMGLGKTIQAIDAANKSKKRILIICPKTLCNNWRNEVHQWLNESVNVIDGTSMNQFKCMTLISDKKWNIITYESFTANKLFLTKLAKDVDLIILDEAHKIRNRSTQNYRAIRDFTKTHRNVGVYCLTGTPVFNYALDLFSLLHLLYPWIFTSSKKFLEDNYYVLYKDSYKRVGGAVKLIRKIDRLTVKNQDNFKKMLSIFMLRRTKDDVLDLPERIFNRIQLELTGSQKRIYTEMEQDFYASLSEELSQGIEVFSTNLLAQITRLKQIAVSKDLLDPYSDDLEGIKISKTLDILDELRDQKVIIFSQFSACLKRLQKILQAKGISNSILTGDMTTDDREYNINKFKTSDNCTVLLATIKAGGVGLNLTESSNVIFLDFEWAPGWNNQAIDRVHRIGQNKKVSIHILMIKDSIEDRIMEILKSKTLLFDESIPTTHIMKNLNKKLPSYVD